MRVARHILAVALLGSAGIAAADDVDAGFDAFQAAQVMVKLASHSWEWGTAAEALLELYNPELSVFAGNPFPSGGIPKASSNTFALAYARQFINRNSQVLVGNSAVGDPASLGVSAILLGQSDGTYINAASRQADYILNDAPKFSNGAVSHRPDVAEIWADNMAMSFPFLAYLAVQNNDPGLMQTTYDQIGLQRGILKADDLNWRHIIGPQSQDTGLWSTGNGWAAYGMVRVLHTMQKWSGSRGMTSQAATLKGWIREILDGAMGSDTDRGLLRNYLNDGSWFGEISGTALLSAVAYRMAVNDAGMFDQKYITWADQNRKTLAQKQGSDGIFRPAVNPLNWLDRAPDNNGSPEGQAFAVHLYTAYRDCVSAGVCQKPPTPTTISQSGIGPIDLVTTLHAPVTFSAMPDPTGVVCGGVVQSCDEDDCKGTFTGLTKFPSCQAGVRKGCRCRRTSTTCGSRLSCDLNGCNGRFAGLSKFAQCTGNFEGCECTPTANTCGARQSCDLNGCAGDFTGLNKFAQCTGNFEGCQCTATAKTCGTRQSCDLNGCAGKFNGLARVAQCTGNFEGCECSASAGACGARQNCDLNGCTGKFNGLTKFAQCTGNFEGCECTASAGACGARQSCDNNGCNGSFQQATQFPQCTNNFQGCQCEATGNTCGAPQDCDMNGCIGSFDISNGKAFCRQNFIGCQCAANSATCGAPQSCDLNNCQGRFNGLVTTPTCSNFFNGCACRLTSNTCGAKQSCDLNGCAGAFESDGIARCQGNFKGCECNSTSKTCGNPLSCDLNGCKGAFVSSQSPPLCTASFAGCPCLATSNTCGPKQSCTANGCNGSFNDGNPICLRNLFGCPCIWPEVQPPPPPPPPTDWGAVCGGPFNTNNPPVCNLNCDFRNGMLCPRFCCAVCPRGLVIGIDCSQ